MVINGIYKDVYIALTGLKENSEYMNRNITSEHITREYFKEIKNKEEPISIIEKFISSFRTDGRTYNPINQGIKMNF